MARTVSKEVSGRCAKHYERYAAQYDAVGLRTTGGMFSEFAAKARAGKVNDFIARVGRIAAIRAEQGA